jgi:hypothetical protein
MKKHIFLALIAIFTVGLLASCNKINFHGDDQLPTKAQQFIDQYFPNSSIVYFEKGGGHYDVRLSGNVELVFDLCGNWTEVDCNNNPVPAGIVPDEIADFVATNYPNNFIVKISRDNQHYEIELNNGIDFEFNLGGNNQVTLPDAAQQFIAQYFAGATVISVELDDFIYEVLLSNGVELAFDMNGNWREVDCKTSAVPQAIVPTNINIYVSISYPNNYIVKIKLENQKYEVELNNHVDLVFDINGYFLYVG